MTADDLLQTIREAGGFMEAAGDRLRVHLKPAALPADLRVALALAKPELLNRVTADAQTARDAIVNACKRAGILPAHVFQAIEGADLAAFADQLRSHKHPDLYAGAYIQALSMRMERDAGVVPAAYTTAAHCEGCGLVWLWPGAERVQACPWCWNRRQGRSIPRP